jgi:hypothetical protein
VVKKVPMLEQFVNGLKTLGVIDVIRCYPAQFLKHVVHCAKSKTPDHLKELFKLKNVSETLLKFVEECSQEGK